MVDNHQHRRAIAAIAIASVLWGTTGIAASYTPGVNPMATGAFAMGFAALLLLVSTLPTLKQDRSLLVRHKAIMLCGGLAVCVYPLAFYSAMRLSGIAIGTLISLAGAPLVAAMLERLISKKMLTLRWYISFFIGVGGVLLLIQSKGQDANTTRAMMSTGVLLGIVAAVSYAVYAFTTSELVCRGVCSSSAMAGQFGIAACILLPSLFFTGDNLFAGSVNITVAVYMALIPMFIGYLCFGYGLKYVSSSQATVVTMIEPAVATLLAVLIVGERFGIYGGVGIALMTVCLWLQMMAPATKKERV